MEKTIIPVADAELIRVEQLPIIKEQLRSLKDWVEAETAEAVSLVCTEDTIQAVKAKRSELRRQFDALEDRRKAVKAAIMDPYEQFEAVYRECVSDAFTAADAALKAKIDDTEREIKRRCEADLRRYFDELCAAKGAEVEWLKFEQTGVRVDMASAKQKTPKKLREQLANFVDRVARDVDAISVMEYADEIFAEYQTTLDFPGAVGAVNERHRRMEEERAAREARAAQKEAEAQAVRKVEALAPPTVKAQEEPELMLTVAFTITDTRDRLIALREWLKANHYNYK